MKKLREILKKQSWKKIFRIVDRQYGLGRLELILAHNWLNPFATLYLDLRSLPFLQALKFPIFVYGRPLFTKYIQ